jgi:hypothetical protein
MEITDETIDLLLGALADQLQGVMRPTSGRCARLRASSPQPHAGQ